MKNIVLHSGGGPRRGLFSFVNQYLAVIRSLHLKNMEVVVDFDLNHEEGYYDSNIEFTNNVWHYYFTSPQHEGVTSTDRTVWYDTGNFYGYSFDYNNNEERLLVEKLISEKLILREEITNEIDKLYDTTLKGFKVLGVHKRGTDIGGHHIKLSLDDYFSVIDTKVDSFDKILLCTDERSVVDAFKLRYDNVVNISYDTLSDNPNLPNFMIVTNNGYNVGKDSIIDAYLLSKSDFLIKANSNLSNFSLLLNAKLPHIRLKS